MIKRIFIMVLILLLGVPPAFAAAQHSSSGEASQSAAVQTVKEHLNKVIAVLSDPSLTGEAGKQTKIEKISDISDHLFDFRELSKRSLGIYWRRFTPKQQTEFVALYKKLLRKTYADRIVSYNNQKIVYGSEYPLTSKTVEVRTAVELKSGNVAINYRLINENGQWRVYDVVIEGVSLISNYRAQFRDILANNTPEGLIDILKKKVG